jgi:predicted TIM-barrel enzyme
MNNRRGFLGAMFAAAAAPAFVRAESLMKIYVPPQGIVIVSSGILTRQQLLEQLLPELNKLFDIEYKKIHGEKQ